MLSSLKLLMAAEPRYCYLTHFGRRAASRSATDSLERQLRESLCPAQASEPGEQRQQRLAAALLHTVAAAVPPRQFIERGRASRVVGNGHGPECAGPVGVARAATLSRVRTTSLRPSLPRRIPHGSARDSRTSRAEKIAAAVPRAAHRTPPSSATTTVLPSPESLGEPSRKRRYAARLLSWMR